MRLSALTLTAICAIPAPAEGQLLGPGDFDNDPIPFDAKFSYGPDELQYAELRLPSGPGPHPVAVVLHGGCWQGWHRTRQIEGVAAALGKIGWATWNLSHRQAVDAGGGWPGTFTDVADGIDFLRQLPAGYALDLDAVVTVGHSAGGQLALWAAARAKLAEDDDLYAPNPIPISGAISLAGVADLQAHAAQVERLCGDGLAMVLGGTPDTVPGRYAQASPFELLPLGVPQLLIHGTEDPAVPVSQIERYALRAREVGDAVQLVVIPGAGHFEPMAPGSIVWAESIEAPLLAFLAEFGAQRGSR